MNLRKNQIIACTYFDKNYLPKGLSLYTSFIKYNPDLKLWILCMDEYTFNILQKMNLKNVTLISLTDFEDPELLKAKDNRSLVEYYWTCTPSLPLFIFKKNPLAQKVIYLDADLYFYSSINPILETFKDQSIYTVEHRYPKGQESRVDTSGRFNVGFQIFKRDKEALTCLNRWRKQCIKWCYWRLEDGKLGDQLYLNEWPKLYKHLHISQNLGVNAAPWNIKQYKIRKIQNNVFIDDDKLICYHFHQFIILGDNSFERSSGYFFSRDIIENIYKPYEENISNQINVIKEMDQKFKIITSQQSIMNKIKIYLTKFLGSVYWNIQTKINI